MPGPPPPLLGRLVEQLHLPAGAAQHEVVMGPFQSFFSPLPQQFHPGPVAVFADHQLPVLRVSCQRRARVPGGELMHRFPRPHLILPPDLRELRRDQAVRQGLEGAPRPNRLELPGVAHQHQFGPRLLGLFHQPAHHPRAHHARFVHHHHVPVRQGPFLVIQDPPPQVPEALVQRGAGDAGAFLQALRRLARQRRPANPIAFPLPGFAGRLQHISLATPRHPADHLNAPRLPGDVLQGLLLLRPQLRIAFLDPF